MGEDSWNKMPYGVQSEALTERPQGTLERRICVLYSHRFAYLFKTREGEIQLM